MNFSLAIPEYFSYICMMKKVGITAILETQLEAANATIRELTLRLESMSRTIEEQSATIKSLESTIKNLEELLLKKDDALSSAEEQKKALGKLIGKKNEKLSAEFFGYHDGSGNSFLFHSFSVEKSAVTIP